jgi:hypothetical protein
MLNDTDRLSVQRAVKRSRLTGGAYGLGENLIEAAAAVNAGRNWAQLRFRAVKSTTKTRLASEERRT